MIAVCWYSLFELSFLMIVRTAFFFKYSIRFSSFSCSMILITWILFLLHIFRSSETWFRYLYYLSYGFLFVLLYVAWRWKKWSRKWFKTWYFYLKRKKKSKLGFYRHFIDCLLLWNSAFSAVYNFIYLFSSSLNVSENIKNIFQAAGILGGEVTFPNPHWFWFLKYGWCRGR